MDRPVAGCIDGYVDDLWMDARNVWQSHGIVNKEDVGEPTDASRTAFLLSSSLASCMSAWAGRPGQPGDRGRAVGQAGGERSQCSAYYNVVYHNIV